MTVYLKLSLTALFWGGTFIAGRAIALDVGVFTASFLRFFIATVCIVLLFVRGFKGRWPRLTRDQVFPAILLGLLGPFAYNVCFFSALQTITASRASVVLATNPAFIYLIAALYFRERVKAGAMVGITLSMAGAVVAISHGHPLEILRGGLGAGELYILGGVITWGIYSVMSKVVMRGMSSETAVTYTCLFGALGLLIPALFEGIGQEVGRYSLVSWVSIFYLGFFGSALGIFWYLEGVKAIGPSRSGVFINFVPISAMALAWLILGETIDGSLILGAAMVTGGAYLTNRAGV